MRLSLKIGQLLWQRLFISLNQLSLLKKGSIVNLTQNRTKSPRIPHVYLVGCRENFDGASQDFGSKCGARTAVIYLENSIFINIWSNCGSGTNTRGELLGFWLILLITKH